MFSVGKLSSALSFLSAKTEMLGLGDQCKISLNDTTKSRQQFKTTNGQSSNDSELSKNPNFDTYTYQWNLEPIEVCAIKALSTGSLCSKRTWGGLGEKGACEVLFKGLDKRLGFLNLGRIKLVRSHLYIIWNSSFSKPCFFWTRNISQPF